MRCLREKEKTREGQASVCGWMMVAGAYAAHVQAQVCAQIVASRVERCLAR